MRALTLHDTHLVVEERPTPTPGATEVLVAVAGAGLNAADLLQRRGFYPAPAGVPADIPGLEMAGTVVAVGDLVTSVAIGARVCAVLGGGGQATHCLVPAEHLIAVPDSVDLVTAGGFAEAFTTAHDALITQANLQPGERVCISGAAGGVGLAALQIAKWRGAHVTAITRDTTHHQALTTLGADQCVTVESSGANGPYDVVLELVGAAHLTTAFSAVAPHGRVVVIGVGGGSRMEIDLLTVMSRRVHLTGSTLRARTRDEKTAAAEGVRRDLLTPWSAGQITVVMHKVWSLDEASTAYDHFATAGKLGKIVLSVSSE
jgi:NADPH:quinone reductase